jgi:predicted TIM-barrel fold metal-dependent hydrolase
MQSQRARRAATVPMFLRRLHTDEYPALPYTSADLRVLRNISSAGLAVAERLGVAAPSYGASRLATANGLSALNDEWGAHFYEVSAASMTDEAAAAEAFHAPGSVVDVQTHFLGDGLGQVGRPAAFDGYRTLMPDWWRGFEGLPDYTLAEYVRCVFLETANTVAVLTSAPFEDKLLVTNDQMSKVRELVERLSGAGRLFTHTVVLPAERGQLDAMETWRDRYQPVGWKVYTLGRMNATLDGWTDPWMLDDEGVGVPFLERARDLGVRTVCVHKGLSGMVDNGSPRDIGPVARAFPELTFIVYHSGYEPPTHPGIPPEGPYTPEKLDEGVNRLIASLRQAGIGPGENVYAELGTTWFSLIRRPIEAAHVLGKLLLAVGEDNIMWGTDSIWYGPAQPAVDAFVAFQIPSELRDQYGYPAITAETRRKILGANAARVYGIDLDAAAAAAATDDLAWIRNVMAEHRAGTLVISP